MWQQAEQQKQQKGYHALPKDRTLIHLKASHLQMTKPSIELQPCSQL
jgi:hypothetical protein